MKLLLSTFANSTQMEDNVMKTSTTEEVQLCWLAQHKYESDSMVFCECSAYSLRA